VVAHRIKRNGLNGEILFAKLSVVTNNPVSPLFLEGSRLTRPPLFIMKVRIGLEANLVLEERFSGTDGWSNRLNGTDSGCGRWG
jgi:hypothetical protein